jgi:hypothetical protein
MKIYPEGLMKPDLFSEIMVVGSGGLIFASLLIVTAALS